MKVDLAAAAIVDGVDTMIDYQWWRVMCYTVGVNLWWCLRRIEYIP